MIPETPVKQFWSDDASRGPVFTEKKAYLPKEGTIDIKILNSQCNFSNAAGQVLPKQDGMMHFDMFFFLFILIGRSRHYAVQYP